MVAARHCRLLPPCPPAPRRAAAPTRRSPAPALPGTSAAVSWRLRTCRTPAPAAARAPASPHGPRAATRPTGPPPRAQELGKYMDEVLVAIAYNLGRCVEFIGPMSELPWWDSPPRPTATLTLP